MVTINTVHIYRYGFKSFSNPMIFIGDVISLAMVPDASRFRCLDYPSLQKVEAHKKGSLN